jgi:hypothetical protein
MFFVSPTSSRLGRRVLAPHRLLASMLRLGGGALPLAGAFACGSVASEEPEATPDPSVGQCLVDADCSGEQACRDAVCVQRVSITSRDSGRWACSVMSCPDGAENCCSAAAASATGNRRQEYVARLQLLDTTSSTLGEVRANFTFDAPDQQGWLTFQLDAEHDLAQIEFTGRHEGVADRFLSVNTNRFDAGGCAFGFDLQFLPRPPGSVPPWVFGSDVSFSDADFCYGNGEPGRASELAFAIFSTGPGDASLIISNITLHAR